MREQRRLAAVLAADVVGYSRLMGRDEGGTLARLKEHRAQRFEPALARNGGRLVKLTGDGVLAEFGSAVDALRAAIEFQQAVNQANAALPEEQRIVFRVGLHVGDLIVDDDDLYGDGVNIAARLEGEAPPGGIVVSGALHEAAAGKLQAEFVDLGQLSLKNIDRQVQAYRVQLNGKQRSTTSLPSPAAVPPPLPDKPSIAVLPFQNMSGDPEQEYFADGLAEDLITALSRTSSLFVIARNSSFSFKGCQNDISAVARNLGVRYVIEGSVRRAGSRVRLTAQLIEASSNTHLWADKYDGALNEVFELQDQIVASVIGAIQPKLRTAEIARASRKRTSSLDAYDLVLRSFPKQAPTTRNGLAEAIELLDRAIALAPGYAEALAYAAWCRVLRPSNGYSSDPTRDFREAADLAERALKADPGNPVALRSAGFVVAFKDRDYQMGWDLIDQSLAIDPNSASSWAWRGWVSAFAGAPENATTEFAKAIRLSPFDLWLNAYSIGMSFALLTSDRFEEGLRWARKGMQEGPYWGAAHRFLIAGLVLTGQDAEARAAAQRYLALEPGFSMQHLIETGPYRRTPNQERVFSAMRLAGLPE
jgi:adenylate cyclase